MGIRARVRFEAMRRINRELSDTPGLAIKIMGGLPDKKREALFKRYYNIKQGKFPLQDWLAFLLSFLKSFRVAKRNRK